MVRKQAPKGLLKISQEQKQKHKQNPSQSNIWKGTKQTTVHISISLSITGDQNYHSITCDGKLSQTM